MSKSQVLRDAVNAGRNRVGLGCWQLGGAWGRLDREEGFSIVRSAAEEGVVIFDTALEYGAGASESILGSALDACDRKYAIITKIPPKNDHWSPPSDADWRDYFPPEWVLTCLRQSLSNLSADYVAVVLLHTWSDTWSGDVLVPLQEAKASGVVAAIGVSVPDFAAGAALKMTKEIDVVELTLSVAEQSPLQVLQRYQRDEVEVVARCPFSSGALAVRWTKEKEFGSDDWRSKWVNDAWRERQAAMSLNFSDLCARYGLQPANAALRFVLSFPEVTCVIPGARTVEQAVSNVRSGQEPIQPLPVAFIRETRKLWDEEVFGPVFNGAA